MGTCLSQAYFDWQLTWLVRGLFLVGFSTSLLALVIFAELQRWQTGRAAKRALARFRESRHH